ncbi:hypothetical protein LR48_Vigan04g172000 [Vigna angularis]|uniref:Uncharacterized protein n=1 Tax=Phaseolus angularis TaxID=3914 RepID=A0A0L9UG49_PHAAN|nr:hypothetical protein LR48_Vigan04g172000 [Vigna angularis]
MQAHVNASRFSLGRCTRERLYFHGPARQKRRVKADYFVGRRCTTPAAVKRVSQPCWKRREENRDVLEQLSLKKKKFSSGKKNITSNLKPPSRCIEDQNLSLSLADLVVFKDFKSLNLSYSDWALDYADSEDFETLSSKLLRLEVLDISWNYLTNDILQSLKGFTSLEELYWTIGPSMFEAEALGLGAMYETGTICVPKPYKVAMGLLRAHL